MVILTVQAGAVFPPLSISAAWPGCGRGCRWGRGLRFGAGTRLMSVIIFAFCLGSTRIGAQLSV